MRHLLISTNDLSSLLVVECIVEGVKVPRSTSGVRLGAQKLFGPAISMRCLQSQDLGSLWTQPGFSLRESFVNDIG